MRFRIEPRGGPRFTNLAEDTVPELDAAGTQTEATPPTQEDISKLWDTEAAIRANPDAQPPAETPPAGAPGTETPATELPQELKDALAKVDDLKALVGNLQHQVRSSDGRVGALQRELQQARSATQAVQRAPNEQTVRAAAKTPEKWAKLKDEFPEWGEAVESLVDTVRAEQPQVDLSPLQTEIQNQINGITQQFHRAVEEAKLFGAYKDYKTIVNSDDFVNFWKAQPAEVQQLTASPLAEDSIRILDMFSEFKTKVKDSTRNIAEERSSKLVAAVARPRGAATPPKDDRELTATELWEQESRRREDLRSRRI